MNDTPFFPSIFCCKVDAGKLPSQWKCKIGLYFVLDSSWKIFELGSFRPSSTQVWNLLIPHPLGMHGCRRCYLSGFGGKLWQHTVLPQLYKIRKASWALILSELAWKKYSSLTGALIFPRDTVSHVPRRDARWWGTMLTDSQQNASG